MKHKLAMVVARAVCWWFGCKEHPQEQYHRSDFRFQCMRCGGECSYGDLVGDTRHNRFKHATEYYLFRKWWPRKCHTCGRRWKDCDFDDDHLPF